MQSRSDLDLLCRHSISTMESIQNILDVVQKFPSADLHHITNLLDSCRMMQPSDLLTYMEASKEASDIQRNSDAGIETAEGQMPFLSRAASSQDTRDKRDQTADRNPTSQTYLILA